MLDHLAKSTSQDPRSNDVEIVPRPVLPKNLLGPRLKNQNVNLRLREACP